MLLDTVWEAVADGLPDDHGGMLCVGCVEERLGRRLNAGDFDWSLSLNTDSTCDSERLADRKRSQPLESLEKEE